MRVTAEAQPRRAALRRWSAGANRLSALIVVAQLCATLAWVVFAWSAGNAVEAASQGKALAPLVLLAFVAASLRATLIWGADILAVRAGDRTVTAARREILEAAAKYGAQFLAGTDAGERASQIVDRTGKLAGYTANWTPGVRLAVAAPLIIVAAVFAQSWLAAVLLFVSVLTLPLFIWLTASETTAAARAQQDSLDALAGAFQARASQAGLIRAFRAIGRETAALAEASQNLRNHTIAILRIAFLSTAVLEFFASISIALVAVYIGFKLLGIFPIDTHETISLAQGMTALILAPEFFAPIRRLSALHHDRADGVAAAEMLANWLANKDKAEVKRLPSLTAAPALRFANVTLAYGGGAPALSEFSAEIEPGEMVALAGSSGAGKTSVLMALLARCQLSAGCIEVNGVALAPGESLAESVAFVRQAPWIAEGSLADNIRLARAGAGRAEIEAAAHAAGVFSFATPDRGGLDLRLSRFGAGLSGGQRQRLALARAIVRDAPLWLLDEPTAHLDPDAEAELLVRLRDLGRDRTVIIATHAATVMAACDRIIRLPAPAQRAAP
jgi:ATP-binding cassette subfamily C protein CydD